jgi:hypothetical protein
MATADHPNPMDAGGAGERKVTVCSSCLTASCWHYEFICDNHKAAGLVDLPISELRRLDREHPDNWSAEKMAKVYGVGSTKHLEAANAR